jgi:signal peptidase I
MCEENNKKKKYFWKNFWKDLLFWFIFVIMSIVLATGMRVFLLCSFKVPSYSMYPAIEPGDFIMVNKQIPGPRVYRDINNIKFDGRVQTKRFKGIRAVRRNDILVFNFPYTTWEKIDMNLNVNYVKRCIAIPGDTFCIENGIYKVKNEPSEILGNLPHQQQLSKKGQAEFSPDSWYCFPHDTLLYNWDIKNFGPLYVPKTGDCMPIDTLNYILYRNLITYETNKPVTIKEGKIYLGEETIDRYSFRMNYYFMSGDWIFDSRDSRYWGLLPEDHIVGKAIIVWKSKDENTGKIRWKRIFHIL